jgi:hypothetical protein
MATAEVLNYLETWPGRSVHGFPTAGNSTRGIGWDERTGRLSDKASLETRLNLIAQNWVELRTNLEVRIGGSLVSSQGHSFVLEFQGWQMTMGTRFRLDGDP